MRNVWQAGLLALALTGAASAADLSGTVWNYVQGKASQKPLVDERPGGMVVRAWDAPAGLQAQNAAFMYMPDLSTDHWMFMLMNPRARAADYLGTSRLQPLGKAGKQDLLTVSRVTAGPFQGLLVMEGQVPAQGGGRDRVLMLLTKQFAAVDPATARYSR